MFRSKVSSLFRSVVNKPQYDAGNVDTFLCRLFSSAASTTDAISTEKYVPDKLYKHIEIEVRGNDRAVLKSYGTFATMAARNLNITMTKNFAPTKPHHDRWTVLKSVHVHKKHRVQYEIRTYFRFFSFEKLTGSTADTFLEYLQRNLPEGVAMKVTKVELQKLPDTVLQASSCME